VRSKKGRKKENSDEVVFQRIFNVASSRPGARKGPGKRIKNEALQKKGKKGFFQWGEGPQWAKGGDQKKKKGKLERRLGMVCKGEGKSFDLGRERRWRGKKLWRGSF